MTTNERWLDMDGDGRWYVIRGRECAIALIRRPHWCDRGNFLAQLHTSGRLSLSVDGCDGWPRYYFDEGAARSECEAWIRKRGQWVDDPAAVPSLREFGMIDERRDPGQPSRRDLLALLGPLAGERDE